jgi:hypothetical protein
MERQSNYDDLALLSITKAAQVMQVGKSRIYDFINTNKIKIVELKGVIRIPYFEIRRCLENLCNYSLCSNKSVKTTVDSKKMITNPKDIMQRIKKSGKANEQ